jgi:hypothetical protein
MIFIVRYILKSDDKDTILLKIISLFKRKRLTLLLMNFGKDPEEGCCAYGSKLRLDPYDLMQVMLP